MEFRLIYEGELRSSGNRESTVDNKHAIRKALHPQLRRLWKVHKGIKQYARTQFDADAYPTITDEEDRTESGLGTIAKRWQRAGFDFVPLVTPEYALRCRLDILLLRPADERFLLNRGDLDGQVKTLFDGLRIPENTAETGGALATQDERPFYCLLSDDRLITEISVTDDQLLLLPHARRVEATDSFVVIHVKINHVYGGAMGRFFD